MAGCGKCIVCGDPARRGRRGPHGKFCGEKCSDALASLSANIHNRRSATPPPGQCTVCGGPTKVALASGRAFKYCGDRCRSQARNLHGIDTIARNCKWCEAPFSTHIVNKVYCSNACGNKAQNERRKGGVNGGPHKHRCKKYQRQYEFIKPEAIFVRDQWICQICFAPVDQDTVFPDPLSATLDHIVPLIRGGDHVHSNVRLAHWGCNRQKHDSLDEEMLCPAADHEHQSSY